MDAERRYTDHEIAAIFEDAARAQHAAHRERAAGGGLTLAELQAIGAEAGLEPAFVARAAARIGQQKTPPKTLLRGLPVIGNAPVTAARTIDLPGPFTDADWDRLVADLRSTFAATGSIRIDGQLRQWRNGNLRAIVEPTGEGHRLRLSTRKGQAEAQLLSGGLFLLAGLLFGLTFLAKGELWGDAGHLMVTLLFVFGGLVGTGASASSLRDWAATREAQMEDVAARAAERALARTTDARTASGDVSDTAEASGAGEVDASEVDAFVDLARDAARASSSAPSRTPDRLRTS